MNGRRVVRRCEQPVLRFAHYAVAFHLAATVADPSAREVGWTSPSLEGRALESYERDMLLYAYRDVAPLVTRPLAKRSRVTIAFPRELAFESEGNPIQLTCWGAGPDRRTRRAGLLTSWTTFHGSKVTVVTLVLQPPPSRASRSRLNEYDLIKLAKLWEGGEGLPEPGSPAEERGPFRFDCGRGEVGLEGLVHQLTGSRWAFGIPSGEREAPADPEPRPHYRVGTITVKLPATGENRQLLADAQAVSVLDPESDRARWKRVVALGGLIQGLLDFDEIGPSELSDVFAEAEVDDESLLAFHKGTLLALSLAGSSDEEEREAELARPIGMSPYLVVPHAVLLHNEQRLKSALIEVDELLAGQERAGRLPAIGGARISIEETDKRMRVVAEALAQHLPNVFHYQSERDLYDGGTKSRGFGDFEPLVRARLEELRGRLDGRVRQRDTWTLGFTITFFAIAALQLALTSVPWWGSLLILVALAALVWQLRRKLF